MKSILILAAVICFATAGKLELKTFHWENCGSSDGITVESMSLEPDPIVVPGKAVLNVVVNQPIDLTAPLKLVVNLEKKVEGVWVHMPCLGHIGSCSYDDVCAILTELFGDESKACPPILADHGIPCHCPIAAGRYDIKDFTVDVEQLPLPPSFLAGDYHIKYQIIAKDPQGRDGTCMDLYASIKAA